ncbi:GNAT family N-acetyltransferase [Actinospica durhamensis]|uniref:GNAT family N-acetyltransferase n=1 Tax=Actinospica durhamensis TaxID=1508375 RepID=A0A941EXY2_9ACTN|nr:GNAT family protein [Actinospica durhamensis]MBR7839076.1 GNAT family N-acetyltransferase [Actinospica durhamensis]
MSSTITLRPVLESDLPMLAVLRSDPVEASDFGWYGHRDNSSLYRSFTETGLLTPDGGSLVVLGGGVPVGVVSWHQVRTAPSSFTWNIGIALQTSGRGHGYGTSAQRALVEYLFAHTLANRVEACTETDNLAEQRSLEKVGFQREGVRRGCAFRDGKWRDMVVYGLVRGDALKDADA